MKKTIVNTLLTVAAVLALSHSMAGDPADGDAVQEARDTVSRWVEIQKIITRERNDWERAHDVLTERIALLESERGKLQEGLDEIREQTGEARSKDREIDRADRSVRTNRSLLEGSIVSLEQRTLALAIYLPAPVRTKLDPLLRRIPSGQDVPSRTLGERYQSVVGVLNELNRFQQEISVYNDLRELPDGSLAEVQTIYFGLGQAYYSTDDGSMAGVGRPGESGWEWTVVDGLGKAVLETAAVLNGQDAPSYVSLPVEVR